MSGFLSWLWCCWPGWGVFSVPLSFCMEGIVRGLCAVTAFPFQLAQYYFF